MFLSKALCSPGEGPKFFSVRVGREGIEVNRLIAKEGSGPKPEPGLAGWSKGAFSSPSGCRGHTGMLVSRQETAGVLIGDGSLGLGGIQGRDLGRVHSFLSMGCGFSMQAGT